MPITILPATKSTIAGEWVSLSCCETWSDQNQTSLTISPTLIISPTLHRLCPSSTKARLWFIAAYTWVGWCEVRKPTCTLWLNSHSLGYEISALATRATSHPKVQIQCTYKHTHTHTHTHTQAKQGMTSILTHDNVPRDISSDNVTEPYPFDV